MFGCGRRGNTNLAAHTPKQTPKMANHTNTTTETPLSSHFCFVIQGESPLLEGNFKDFLTKYDKKSLVTYAKYAKEEGGDTDNIHYHVFLRTNKQQRNSYFFNTLREDSVPFHFDVKVVNVKQALDYIGNTAFTYSDKHPDESKRGKTKGGKCHWVREYGDPKTVRIPKAGSGGNDLDTRLGAVKALLEEGATIRELYDHDFGVMVRYGKQIRDYISVVDIESEAIAHIELVGKRISDNDRKHKIEIEHLQAEFDRQVHDMIKSQA